MRLSSFDAFCRKLPASTFVVQWGGSHVHKIGSKVFAIGQFTGKPAYVFKTTPLRFELLIEQGMATRAPYLRRGTWVQVSDGVPDAELRLLLRQSYDVVVAGLTKAVRADLGV
ncbi:MmcQ/YjbR family DNA-binding protein [Acidocella sp.]|uniref:MmcQ/YjbR family DNA-binding protein n=1 Tax=Acidocella sp. TaxID=50710 RepID=UPI001852A46B|nr:MmcQ/YjbR family DNA-binding protein [Acidocella sp.]NNM56656.1 MmcQ/YjbR family DNA-binding protein [Acidocella sp.]